MAFTSCLSRPRTHIAPNRDIHVWRQHQSLQTQRGPSPFAKTVHPSWQVTAANHPFADDREDKQQIEARYKAAPPTKRSRWEAVQDFIKAKGPGAFLAYITVSNILSVGMLSSAWVLFTRTTGQTPLQAWPQFLACYAGVWAAQHLARPYKIALGLAASPAGTAALAAARRVFKVGSNTALALLLVMEAVLLLSCLGAVVLYSSRMVA